MAYAFSAVIGQIEMKLGILVAAVRSGDRRHHNPGRSRRGKSTAIGALAALLPRMSDVVGQKVTGWGDASGHSAIVGCPTPRSAVKDIDLQVGDATVLMRLQRVSVGAGSREVHETEFPYDPEHVGYASAGRSTPPAFHRFSK